MNLFKNLKILVFNILMCQINFELKIIYYHIPKNAGTYIRDNIKKYNFIDYSLVLLNENKDNNDNNINNINNIKKRVYNSKIGTYEFFNDESFFELLKISRKEFDNFYKFTFVRNPYTRFISGYNFVLSMPYISKNLLNNDTYKKFENLEYMIDNRNDLSDNAYNHIFITQYDHVKDINNEINFNFIGRYENLYNDMNYLIKNIFLKDDVISKEYSNKNKINYLNYKEYYNENIFIFVNTYFEKDFTFFNYKKFDNYNDFLVY